MLTNRWITWILIFGILLLPVPAIVGYLQTYIVRNAVVTAFCYDVHAPIDGIVESLSIRPGDIPDSPPALVLNNNRIPRANIDGLKAGCLEKKNYLAALQTELGELRTRLTQSRAQLSAYRSMLRTGLDQTLAILKAREEGDKAGLDVAAKNQARIQTLEKTAAATRAEADRAEAEYLEAKARLKETRLEQRRVALHRKMMAQDLLPPDLSDAALQVQNQINTLNSLITDCKRRINHARRDIAADEQTVKALYRDLELKSTTAEVILPDTAVIWDVDAQTGMEVTKGDKLLSYIDRGRLMVDVAVDDATIELIRPDLPVRIRLFGSGRFIQGKVYRVMGSAAEWPEQRIAAGVKERSHRDGRVLVAIEDSQLFNDVKKFCGVGRTAYAEFEGIGLVEQYFGTFLR